MESAFNKIRASFLTESEVAALLNVDGSRIRDLRSHHVTGKLRFIDHIKPTTKCVLYRYEDVLAYMDAQDICSFGVNKNGLDEDEE